MPVSAINAASRPERVDPATIFNDPQAAALAAAMAEGDDTRTEALIPQVSLSVNGDRQVTLLQWALLHGNRHAVRALLKAGADPAQPGLDDDTVMHMAAMTEDPGYLSDLLASGADPDTPHPVSGATPLHAALRGDRAAQFHQLLAAHADPGRADRSGNTPLHMAGMIAAPDRVLALLQAGADPASRNAQGLTFQHFLFMERLDLLNASASAQWESVVKWLEAHNVPLGSR